MSPPSPPEVTPVSPSYPSVVLTLQLPCRFTELFLPGLAVTCKVESRCWHIFLQCI